MRRSRFSEDQIIGIVREQEAGMKVADVWRKYGISDATFYTWTVREQKARKFALASMNQQRTALSRRPVNVRTRGRLRRACCSSAGSGLEETGGQG